MSKYRLEVRGVTKVFPGTRALDQVQLQVRPGEVHALCGENGAGKSTLMNIIGGVFPPTEGEILFEGAPIAPRSPKEAQDRSTFGGVWERCGFRTQNPHKNGSSYEWLCQMG